MGPLRLWVLWVWGSFEIRGPLSLWVLWVWGSFEIGGPLRLGVLWGCGSFEIGGPLSLGVLWCMTARDFLHGNKGGSVSYFVGVSHNLWRLRNRKLTNKQLMRKGETISHSRGALKLRTSSWRRTSFLRQRFISLLSNGKFYYAIYSSFHTFYLLCHLG